MVLGDLCCLMFSEMFKDIIENHIKHSIGTILKINQCSILTIENILSDDLIETLLRNTEINTRTSRKCKDYSFLKPALLSHIFSDIFLDVIKSIADKNTILDKKKWTL